MWLTALGRFLSTESLNFSLSILLHKYVLYIITEFQRYKKKIEKSVKGNRPKEINNVTVSLPLENTLAINYKA